MKKYPLLLIAFVAVSSYAQEASDTVPSDSVKVQALGEVVVEANRIIATPQGLKFIPSKSEKRAAVDATQLLRLMNMPQYLVDPQTGAVTTLSGVEVTLFIDYAPATSEDISNMRTEDVERIDFMENPEDPRFNGARAVLNFIMRQYQWGGYTRLSATVRTLSQSTQYFGGFYSKFSYRRMTFDLWGQYWSWNDNYAGERCTETFRDVWYDGTHYDTVTKVKDMLGRDRKRQPSASARAVYQSADGSVFIQHHFSYGYTLNPASFRSGTAVYTPDIVDGASSYELNRSKSHYPALGGYHFYKIHTRNSLVVNYRISYSRNTAASFSSAGDAEPITSDTREDAWTYFASLAYKQALRKNNNIQARLSYNAARYDTRYRGTAYMGDQTLDTDNAKLNLYYVHQLCSLYLWTQAGLAYTRWYTNSEQTLHSWEPVFGASLNWKINPRHTANLQLWCTPTEPSASQTNTVISRSDILIWHQGNPDLDIQKYLIGYLSYSWLPTSHLTFSATWRSQNVFDPVICRYLSGGEQYSGVVRSYCNTRRESDNYVALSATWRGLPGNKLSVRLTPFLQTDCYWGVCRKSVVQPLLSLNLSYYTGGFSASAWVQTTQKYMESSGATFTTHPLYQLDLSYKHGPWTFSVITFNWFNKHNAFHTVRSTSYYSSDSRSFTGASYACGTHITLTYTFGYGKQVSRDNELDGAGSSSSAILK